MPDTRFLSLLKFARAHSYLGLRPDYWHGYQRGLRRGFQGELFSTNADHELWLRLAADGDDEASKERGRGYQDGLAAWAIAEKTPRTGPTLDRTDDTRHRSPRYRSVK